MPKPAGILSRNSDPRVLRLVLSGAQVGMASTQRRLIIVTDAFEVAGRCICPCPVVPYSLVDPTEGERLKPGDQLELRKPDGTVTKVQLYGLGWPSPVQSGLIIQLEPSVKRDDLPAGTEIWKVSGTE